MRMICLFVLVALTAAQAVGQTPMNDGPAGGGPAAGKAGPAATTTSGAPAPAPQVVEYRHIGEVSHVHRWHAGGGRRNATGARRVRGGISVVSLKQFENVERTVLREEFPKAYLHGEQMAVKDPTVFEGRSRITANGFLIYDAARDANYRGPVPPVGQPLPFAFGAVAQTAPAPQPGAPGGAQPPAGGLVQPPPVGEQTTPGATAPAVSTDWGQIIVWTLVILAIVGGLIVLGRYWQRHQGQRRVRSAQPTGPAAGGATGAGAASGPGRPSP